MEHKTTIGTDCDRFVTPMAAFSGALGFGKFKDYSSVSLRVPVLDDASAVTIQTSPRAHRFNYPATDGDYPADDYVAQGIMLEFDMDEADVNPGVITDNVQGLALDEQGDPTFQDSAATAGLGNGLAFDGTDDAFDVAFADAAAAAAYTLPDTEDFSVEVVFKTTDTTSGTGDTLVCCRDGAAGIGWQMKFDATDHVDFQIDDTTEVTLEGQTDVDTGSIVHVVATLDRDGNGTLYVNGAAEGSNGTKAISGADGTLINPSADTRFCTGGDAAQGGTEVFTGSIYFVRVYNKVLTATEVLDNYRVLLNQGGSGWTPLSDPADGDDLVVCKSGSDPIEFDLTEYMALNANAFRACCSVEQTTTPADLDFTWVFRK